MLENKSLRWKINLLTVLILVVISMIFGVVLSVYEISRREEAVIQIEQNLNDLTQQYAEQVGNEIFASQSLAVRETLKELCKRRHILDITTYTDDGQSFISSSAAQASGLNLSEMARLNFPVVTQTRWAGQSVLNYLSPIVAYGEQVGFWVVRYDLTTLNNQTFEIMAIFIALILSVALLLGILLNKILLHFVVDPVLDLQRAMQDIEGRDAAPESVSRQGDSQAFARMVLSFDQHTKALPVSAATRDEIGSLAYAFRNMLVALRKAYSDIRTDSLTGLANRLRLDECLEQAVNRAWSDHIAVAVVLIDIDHFKQINDRYGHLTGDQVLKHLAAILSTNLEPHYTPGRWGGEEFLVVLPETGKDAALSIAEKLRAKISDADFADVAQVTASFGVSCYERGDSVDRLVRRADTALYQAKEAGRNRALAL